MDLFYSTEPAPCPYLPGRQERRLVTFLEGANADRRHEELMRAGFRRSQNLVYRPACPGCRACVPVRLPVADFVWSRSFRRILRRNADLVASERPAVATAEQFALFHRYLTRRHGDGGMSGMGFDDYRRLVEETTVATMLVEFRDADRRLVAVALTDRVASGLSGVYKFFEPDEPGRSCGSFVILWMVARAAEQGLDHVYLGYWIAKSPKMAYKSRFRPIEELTAHGWSRMVAAAPVVPTVTDPVAKGRPK